MSNTVLSLIKFVQENKDLLKGKPALIERIQNVLRKAHDDDADWENQGFSVVDGPEGEEDEADKWLREQEEQKGSDTQPKSKRRVAADPDAIKGHISRGFSENEAKYFEGDHDYPSDYDQAFRGQLDKTIDSPEMWKLFSKHADEAIKEHTKKEQQRADVEKNPMKYAAGQGALASDLVHQDFDDDYNTHINNPDHENMSLEDLHAAMNDFHDKRDPAEAEKIAEAGSKASEAALSARKIHATNYQERLRDFIMGGHAMGVGSGTRKVGSSDTTDQSAIQHAGTGSTIQTDPEAKFAASHQDYVKHLSEEQQSRLKRVNTAKAAQKKPEGQE